MQPATKSAANKAPAARSAAPAPHRPVHEVRMGRVSAAIWENETPNGTRHNVTVSRFYKEGDEWKRSTSFGRDDLPLVIKVLDGAHSWIYEHAHPAQEAESRDQA